MVVVFAQLLRVSCHTLGLLACIQLTIWQDEIRQLRCVITFALKVGSEPADIHQRFSAQFREDALLRKQVYEWYTVFTWAQPVPVDHMNGNKAETLILHNCWISAYKILKVNISVSHSEKIIHEYISLLYHPFVSVLL
jgi:hypothetical protein